MGSLFSKSNKKKQSKVNEHDMIVLKLKGARDRLDVYQKRLEIVIEEEVTQAKALLAQGKKDRALMLMRRKKMQERMVETANKQMNNVLEMIDNVQIAKENIAMKDAMADGLKTLQSLQKECDVDTIKDMMDDTAEAFAVTDEINQLLSESLSPEDDEEAYESLMELTKQQELADAAALKAKLDEVGTSGLDPLNNTAADPQQQQQQQQQPALQAA
eukprot:TRINITY_DN2601_c0_g1_i1.p1 TRINITY_DN2601_c0_g1~~TRINITY_DN2601_c0_g1_i1.p1  ORF type:complete len:250 (+),score=84.52 TRINITY_DN2601_c0_g1_i1:103-750(+)